ncbi:conserved unknown protein [Ectocarpus siliculosus]|uniref:Uncharacterized protein n=1 Tax=Ectocarpus siliculosus TaxID=2880 RepID=D8LE34_ECTSI|nr:conserved unknown protein [Ectocarpus siliculosus]|eukprot:CBN78551.1 conserved unknown protein [Ectocarpus siliculosus]
MSSQLQVDDGAASSSDNLDNEGVCQPGNENTGRWTSDEHRLFLRGLELHGKGWKQIATLIQTRTVVQIRTHAQKYFQKLSKAQASGTSHLDPATLMSTMDAGKPRPASVSRNLRSSTMANSPAESEGRLMSLRKRRNRGRHPRHDDDQDYDTNSEESYDYARSSATTRTRRRRRSVSSGSSGGGGGGSSESEEEDGEGGGRGHRGVYRETALGATTTTTMMMMVRQAEEAPAFTVGGGNSGAHGAEFDEEEAEEELDESVDVEGHNSNNKNVGISSSLLHGGTAGTWSKRRPAKSHRPSPTKASKAAAIAAAGGAADARALAWEAAAAKAAAGEEGEEAAADGVVGGGSGTKRHRSESVSSSSNDASLGKTIKSLKRTGGSSQTTRISPTSVADVNSFMSFPVPQTERSDMAMHHLPQQLAPSWCTKPQDTWMAGAGLDMGGLEADDAGPFRWFIDERSLSAPGAFFQPPVETWSGSDTTDVSTSAGSDHQHHRTVVPEHLPSNTNKVDMSPGGVLTSDNTHNQEDVSIAKHRGMMEPIVPISDAAMASEVSRHVEADSATACAAAGCAGGASASAGGAGDGGHSLDITSGLWLDHPQEAHEAVASPLMYGLGLSAPANTGGAGGGGGAGGLGGGLSLPSLDEEEVLGFLACAEENSRQAAAAAAGGDADENDLLV